MAKKKHGPVQSELRQSVGISYLMMTAISIIAKKSYRYWTCIECQWGFLPVSRRLILRALFCRLFAKICFWSRGTSSRGSVQKQFVLTAGRFGARDWLPAASRKIGGSAHVACSVRSLAPFAARKIRIILRQQKRGGEYCTWIVGDARARGVTSLDTPPCNFTQANQLEKK